MTPFLQAQAPTLQPMSTWQHPPPGPTCPGRPAMTEASSRHSQSGTALCESSLHALLPAFSPSNALSVVTENVFFRVVFRTVVKAKTWIIHGCPVCVSFFCQKKIVATKLNMTQSILSCCCYCFGDAWLGAKNKKILYSLFLPLLLQSWQTESLNLPGNVLLLV